MARRDTYVIEFRTTGTARVQRNIAAIGKSANSTRRALAFLRSFLVIFASVAIFSGVFRLADAFTNLNNRLKLLTDNTQVLAALRQEVFRLANDNRVAVDQFAEILFRVTRATLGLGLEFGELVKITDTVTKAVKLSGSSAASAEAGLVQFAQGLAGAALEGQELASVVEQLPALADIIAREFTPELISLGFLDPRANTEALGGFLRPLNRAQLGLLKLPRLIKAIEAAFDKTADSFERVDITIGDAFTQLRNKAILFAGTLNDTTGAANGVIKAIQFVGDNLAAITLGLTALIGLFVFNFIIAQITSLGAKLFVVVQGVFKLGTAFKNAAAFIGRVVLGIGATVSGGLAILGVVAAWFLWGDAIKETIASFGGLAQIGKNIIAFLIALVITLVDEWELLAIALPALFIRGLSGILDALGSFAISSFNFFKELFIDIVEQAAAFGITVGRIIFAALSGEFEKAGQIADDFFGESVVNALTTPEGALKAVADGVTVLGDALIRSDKAAQELGGTFEGNFKTTLENFEKLLNDPANKISPEAIAILLANTPRGSSNFGLPDRPDEDEIKRIAKLQDALDSLLSGISPLITANLALAEATEILNQAEKDGLDLKLSRGEIDRRIARDILCIGQDTTDYAEKLKLLNGELSEHITETEKAVLVNAAFEEFAGNFLAIENAVSPLAAATRELAEAQRELDLAVGKELVTQTRADEIFKQTKRDMLGVGNAAVVYTEKMILLNMAVANGTINQEEFRQAAINTRVEFLESQRTMAAGAERAMLKIEDAYSNTAANVESAFTTVFSNLEDRLVDFVETGIFSIRDFLDVIRQEISRAFFREAIGEITGLFNDLLGNILPGAGEIGVDPEVAASEALVVAKNAELLATQAVTAEQVVLHPNLLTFNTLLTTSATTVLPPFNAACIAATTCLQGFVLACETAAASAASGGDGGGGGGSGDFLSGFGGLITAGVSAFAGGGGGFGSVNDGGALGGQGTGNFDLSNQGSFAHGGSFTVGGGNSASLGAGIDNRLVQFRAQAGEEVDITPRGARRRMGGNNVTVNVNGVNDFDRFKRNQNSIGSRVAGALSRSQNRSK